MSAKPIEDKRERIIQAAVKVFARQGLERGKIADIAMEAGIGKGTIYEYFRSKEDIFAEIVAGFFQEMAVALEPFNRMDLPPREKAALLIDSSFDMLGEQLQADHADEWTIMIEIFAHGLRADSPPELQEVIMGAVREMIGLLVPTLEEGIAAGVFRKVDPVYFALVLFGALDGLALHYYLQRDRLDLDKLKTAAREILLNGILTKEAHS